MITPMTRAVAPIILQIGKSTHTGSPGRGIARRNASASSCAVWWRIAGSFSRHFMTTRSTSGGTFAPGLTFFIEGGFSLR